MTNIEIKFFSLLDENNIQNACLCGAEFFDETLNCSYKKLSQAKLFCFLETGYDKFQPTGHFQTLLVEEEIPRDVYIDIAMKPTYALASISIYAYLKGNSFFNSKENLKKFSSLLDACLTFKLRDHGYDAEIGRLQNLLLFCKSNLREFINLENPISQHFADFMKQEITALYEIAKNYHEHNKDHYVFAFEPYNATAKIQEILAAYEGKTNAIFVYGTLMTPFQANKTFLEESKFCGGFSLEDYAIYDLGNYPAIKPVHNKVTYGEVWFVDDAILLSLDDYEGEGFLYSRKKVTAKSIHGELDCFVYVYNGKSNGNLVEGRWRHTSEDKIWYACYGSNLSAERFSYYIKGGHYKGKDYTGCKDKALWQDSYWQNISGTMYFAQHSTRWDNSGVAFYTPNIKGKTIMRLYKISREQLAEIQCQEGKGSSWYNKIHFLGFAYDGYPIYTLTNSETLFENAPCQSYLSLIETALTEECRLTDVTVKSYLDNCHL
ncbi:MAG: gamma-glutamylcyclotransferase [Phascolarctobacterium sp.]|nr:gamma-glutamylcyclotransferase [Phascolarctobacterium sp.]